MGTQPEVVFISLPRLAKDAQEERGNNSSLGETIDESSSPARGKKRFPTFSQRKQSEERVAPCSTEVCQSLEKEVGVRCSCYSKGRNRLETLLSRTKIKAHREEGLNWAWEDRTERHNRKKRGRKTLRTKGGEGKGGVCFENRRGERGKLIPVEGELEESPMLTPRKKTPRASKERSFWSKRGEEGGACFHLAQES